jgi:transcriptional regulator with XRE-family HTH domain
MSGETKTAKGAKTNTRTAIVVAKSDIEVVCRFAPAWGAAFKRLREKAGYSQSELAELVECDRTSISQYESEVHKPEAATLRALLEAMGADPRILFRYFELPPEIRAVVNSQLNPEDAATALGKILLDAPSNEGAVGAIVDFMSPKVLAAVSVKALHDVQAAKLFFERADKLEAEKQRRRNFPLDDAINISPSTQFLSQPKRDEE